VRDEDLMMLSLIYPFWQNKLSPAIGVRVSIMVPNPATDLVSG